MTSKNKALIVGISGYPNPADVLPSVDNDVREMARLLASSEGAFGKDGTILLTESQATRDAILNSLAETFSASSSDTVFVYLAGHGGVENGEYYFVSHDANKGDLAGTAVPLREIKRLFDDTISKRVLLWLDFCHSGGMLRARGAKSEDDDALLRRTLKVIHGQGRIIIAACTADQPAYEDASIGHGLFTHALLRGLKGEAKQQNEVTASSLYDFIDRELAGKRQTPMFFGQITGRIVLMHYHGPQMPLPATAKQGRNKPREDAIKSSGDWVMMGNEFFAARRVGRKPNGDIEIEIPINTAVQESAIRQFDPNRSRARREMPFAFRNDGMDVTIKSASSETINGGDVWTFRVTPKETRSTIMEMSYSDGNHSYTADDLAVLRAKFILLNQRPSKARSAYGYSEPLSLFDVTSQGGVEIKPVIRETFLTHNEDEHHWREFARLKSIYRLKMTATIEDVLDLTIGPVNENKVTVAFRGRRQQQYQNAPSFIIEFTGECSVK